MTTQKSLFQEGKIQVGNIHHAVHLATTDDDLRPVMCHILVTKQYVVASDAHILVRILTSRVFQQSFVEGFPCDRFLIHRSAWAKLLENKIEKFGWSADDPDCIIVNYGHDSKREYALSIRIKREGDGLNYPAWEKVMPDAKQLFPFSCLSFVPSLLDTAFRAMTTPDERIGGARLYTTKKEHHTSDFPTTAIAIIPNSADAYGAMGIIMPMMPNIDTKITW